MNLGAFRSLLTLVALCPLSTASLEAGDKQFQHVVVVMMENRSFDHFLAWHPTADGMQEGLSYP
jgi:phospholipase C